MSAREKAGDGEPHHAFLSDDDAMDVLLDPSEELGGALWFEGSILGSRHRQKSRTEAPGFQPCELRSILKQARLGLMR